MSEPNSVRRSVRCKHCDDAFSYVFRVTPEQLKENRIIVKMTCPFCKHKLSVDLAPWKRNATTSYRGGANDNPATNPPTLHLPDELPSELAAD